MRRALSRVGSLVIAFVTSAAILFAAAAPASAGAGGYELRRGEALYPGQYIQATYGGLFDARVYRLIMQSDGNLVLYKGPNPSNFNKVCWASNTAGYGWNGTYAIYQNDGNFVIYTLITGVPIWASNSVGDPGTTVDINANGRLYVGYKQMSNNC